MFSIFLEAFTFQTSSIEKSFLFDVSSKIYIATDSSPVEMAGYELCCDMIDVAMDLSGIYGFVFFQYWSLTQCNVAAGLKVVIGGLRSNFL